MNPYFAVIYDSFKEALRSKVLWVLLVCWTLILGGIAPLGFIQDKSFTFKGDDIVDDGKLIGMLSNAANGKGSKSQQAVVAVMKPTTQAFFKQRVGRSDVFTPRGRIVQALNEVLTVKDLYNAETWPKADRRSELKDLVTRPADQLSKLELENRNRRLVELSFPGQFRSANADRTWVGYAGLKTPLELPISVKQARQYIEALFFPTIMKLGLGIFAMLVAIIITSPMIPDMFQSGALHLLLSKPVSRSMLFLSKFVGGCVFVAVNIAYMLVGLYFISGIRLGIWNSGILLCIPLFIFVFMIFYSVSALAGLIWKNPIICVVVTGVFWGLCFVVGLVYGITTPLVTAQPKLLNIAAAGDTVFATSQQGLLQVWDSKSNSWQSDFGMMPGNFRIFGPYWYADKGQLLFARTSDSPIGGFDNSTVRFRYATYPELAIGVAEPNAESADAADMPSDESTDDKNDPQSETTDAETAKASDNEVDDEASKPDSSGVKPTATDDKQNANQFWSESRVDFLPDFPSETRRIIRWRDSVLALTTRGIYQFDMKAAISAKKSPNVSLFGLSLPIGGKDDAFRLVTPESWQPKPPLDFAASPDGSTVIVYSGGQMQKLLLSESGLFRPEETTAEISKEEDTLSLVSVSNNAILVASDKSIPQLYSVEKLEPLKALDGVGKISPRHMSVAPNGKDIGLLTSENQLWIVDTVAQTATQPPIAYQGKIHGFSFDDKGRLWYSHDVTQVDCVDLTSNTVATRIRPNSTTLGWIYTYIIKPAYTVNPKPAAVDETITYILRKDDTLAFLIDTGDLNREAPTIDPWTPLWSNAIFIVFMLSVGCVILYRQDL
jgi:ABC-type transport system involved in multi-copper enzyme maturation permease subunit